MRTPEKNCLCCKHYRITDARGGFCRAAIRRGEEGAVRATMVCETWADCGQTYYIRLGWLKHQAAAREGESRV